MTDTPAERTVTGVQVPGEVLLAHMTERPEFIALLRGRAHRGEVTTGEVLQLCDYVEGAIRLRAEIRADTQRVAELFQDMRANAFGVSRKIGVVLQGARVIAEGSERPDWETLEAASLMAREARHG